MGVVPEASWYFPSSTGLEDESAIPIHALPMSLGAWRLRTQRALRDGEALCHGLGAR